MNVALRPEPLNILSICTGGGGLDLGVELAVQGAQTVCMVEREAFACAQLVSAMEAGLMAPAPIWSDARTFDGRAWRGAVDGLIGGIPCQPHSLAGRKQGSNDARDLWSTARRIIVQSRVWFVVIENVGGMLSAGSDEIAGAQRVFRDLHKLGFEVEGGLFTASEVGASHQRKRIFIVAAADRDNKQRRGQHEFSCRARQGARQQSDWDRDGFPGVGQADTYCERLEGLRADDRESRWEDARRSFGLCDRATVVDPESIGCREGRPETEFRRGRHTASGADGAVVHAVGCGRSGRAEVAQRGSEQRAAHERASRPTLFPPGPGDIEEWRSILSRSPELEPAFRRVADGLASRLDIARVDRLRMLGNGVVPLQAAYALRTLVTRLAARGSAGAARLVRMMEPV